MDIKTLIDIALLELVKSDELYFTSDFTQFSTSMIDGYKKWSDLQNTFFAGYSLNEMNKF